MLSYQTFATFPNLFYQHTLCYFINVCRLIKLSSSYQSFVIFSLFLVYSLFFAIYAPYKIYSINAPVVHTASTTLTLILSCARSLCQYTFPTHQASLAIVPFRLGGGSDRGWGFPCRTNRYVLSRRLKNSRNSYAEAKTAVNL